MINRNFSNEEDILYHKFCEEGIYLIKENYGYLYTPSEKYEIQELNEFVSKEYAKVFSHDFVSPCSWINCAFDAARYIYFYVRNPSAGEYTQYFNLFLGGVVLVCLILLFFIALGECCCKKKEEKAKVE
jgi:hypothetical protein